MSFLRLLIGKHSLEFLRYFLASAVALAFDFGVYLIFVEKKLLEVPQAAAVGYAAGMFISYYLMANRVFKNGWLRTQRLKEVGLFLISGGVGIVVTYLTAWSVVEFLSPQIQLAKGAAVGVSFFAVYIFRKLLVFKPTT